MPSGSSPPEDVHDSAFDQAAKHDRLAGRRRGRRWCGSRSWQPAPCPCRGPWPGLPAGRHGGSSPAEHAESGSDRACGTRRLASSYRGRSSGLFTRYCPFICLTISSESETTRRLLCPLADGKLQRGQKRGILGKVIGARTQEFAQFGEHPSCRVLDVNAEAGRTRVAARPAVAVGDNSVEYRGAKAAVGSVGLRRHRLSLTRARLAYQTALASS